MQTKKAEFEAIKVILDELKSAKEKWPKWVDDPVHAAGILNEEAGELMQASLDFCYSNGNIEQMQKEAAQVGAMAIRFLENIKSYIPAQRYK